MNHPPRFLPNRPLPDYSYVPGLWPHPHSQLEGGLDDFAPPDVCLDQANWGECEPYLRGIDLWNHGYYWEAHEAWELLWHAAGRSGAKAVFFKGMIQLAVAGVKVRESRAESVIRHARRAAELFQESAASWGGEIFFGLSLIELARIAGEIADDPPECPARLREKVRVVFSMMLLPKQGLSQPAHD